MSDADAFAPTAGPTSTAGPTTTGEPARFVCVVLHDVANATLGACLRTIRAIADVAPLPLTLLAVPRYHDEPASADVEAWLAQRTRGGDELALHGFSHRDDLAPQGVVDAVRRRVYTRGEGEFWALSEEEATRRLAAGVAWFASRGWPLHGFVAPAWLLGPGGWAALARQRFAWTATVRELVHLPGRAPMRSQSVVYSTSSGWRRELSVGWNAAVAWRERGNPLLRIELHPRDADFPAIRRSWQRILERALRNRSATTVADYMRRTRPESAAASTTTLWQSTSAE